ncbi:hypothetical protein SUGI_0048880 [Cryptomeria japonica]|nr:hypothetical protein SUGI_0048880 [Cryptomeria japonica]
MMHLPARDDESEDLFASDNGIGERFGANKDLGNAMVHGDQSRDRKLYVTGMHNDTDFHRDTVSIKLATKMQFLANGLKVGEYYLLRRLFSDTGGFIFGIQEHIDLGIKYDYGIYGLDEL